MAAWEDDDWLKRLIEGEIGGERERQQERARRMGMAFADLDRVLINQEALDSMPVDFARELRALPVKRDGQTLWVAFAEPNSPAESKIVAATRLRVIPVLCVKSALDRALTSL